MATPMTASQWLAQCKKWGVKVNTTRHPGWATHNRNHIKAYGPVQGVVIHHTASGSSLSVVDLVYNGTSSLPGPLANGCILDDGTLYMTGWGRCNHAGSGSSAVLNAMIADRMPPFPPGSDSVDGNSRLYGFEFAAAGSRSDNFTAAQIRTAVLISCAILDFHKWTVPEASIIGHYQWTLRKPEDPAVKPTVGLSADGWDSLDWPKFMAAVKAQLKAGPGTTPEGDDVALSTEDKNWLKATVEAAVEAKLKALVPDLVWRQDTMTAPGTAGNLDTNPTWWPQNVVRGAYDRSNEAKQAVAEVAAVLAAGLAKLESSLDLDLTDVKQKVEEALADVTAEFKFTTAA